MKKILIMFTCLLSIMIVTSCSSKKTLAAPTNVTISEDGNITWDAVENATEYVVCINTQEYNVKTTSYLVKDLKTEFTYSVYAKAEGYENSPKSSEKKYTPAIVVKPPLKDIKVAIEGPSQLKSGNETTLKATVTGTTNTSVTWSIVKGQEFATISKYGVLTAKSVDGDKVVEINAVSAEDTTVVAKKVITIVSKPILTQSMLDEVNVDKVQFDGYININLYTIGLFEKLESSYVSVVKTAMDGTSWYAEYENEQTATIMNIYYKNHNSKACQVGLSFTNEEQYTPLEDDNKQEVSWEDSGLYNNLKGLEVTDFKFNEKTWRYEYAGSDKTLPQKIAASSNPYDFETDNFSLIISDDQIMGIYSVSKPSFAVADGYKAIQELNVSISTDDSIEVPTISKYSHDPIHDDLATAIQNMKKLDSYTLNYYDIQQNVYNPGLQLKGYKEEVTNNLALFTPLSYSYDETGKRVISYDNTSTYGYKKINDELFNSFFLEEGEYGAARAFAGNFKQALPSFEFAAEIFRNYFVDKTNGTTTYYVDDLMNPVASTFYKGVGNDSDLYGIFAQRGYTSETESFTPYVTVKDGYIVKTGFYYYLGSIYGVAEIEYDNFDTTTITTNVEFTTRNLPVSFSELTIQVSEDSDGIEEDVETNALEYFKTFFANDSIDQTLPFFGDVLGDTFGFGLTTIKIPGGSHSAKKAISLYYDVPLGIDYTIGYALKNLDKFLTDEGYVRNEHGEYSKDGIVILPVDSSLDLFIYIWKA